REVCWRFHNVIGTDSSVLTDVQEAILGLIGGGRRRLSLRWLVECEPASSQIVISCLLSIIGLSFIFSPSLDKFAVPAFFLTFVVAAGGMLLFAVRKGHATPIELLKYQLGIA